MLFFIILHSFKSIIFQNDIFLFFKMHGWSYWFWTLGSINLNWNYNFTLFCDFSISSSKNRRFNNRDLLRNLDLTRFGHLPSFLVCLPRWRHSRQGLGNIPWSFTWHLLHFLIYWFLSFLWRKRLSYITFIFGRILSNFNSFPFSRLWKFKFLRNLSWTICSNLFKTSISLCCWNGGNSLRKSQFWFR